MTSWFAGIGQGQVAATPIQMANVAATIAREGVWMKPTLIADSSSPPDRIDLKLSPQAIALVSDANQYHPMLNSVDLTSIQGEPCDRSNLSRNEQESIGVSTLLTGEQLRQISGDRDAR